MNLHWIYSINGGLVATTTNQSKIDEAVADPSLNVRNLRGPVGVVSAFA